MTAIQSQVKSCFTEINNCLTQAGRDTDEVILLAVSKTRTDDELRQAHAAGCHHFGESYVQEAIPKISALSDLPLQWHFIGPIQSNKTQDIARHFTWVHSIDREKIAKRLNDQRPDSLPALNVCIQVNISGEASKSGVTIDEISHLAECIRQLPRLHLRGLMAIPLPFSLREKNLDATEQREPFKQLREKRDSMNKQGFDLDTLSMGMSDDFCAAIMEGASIVRPGTRLFGARPAK